MFIECLCVSHCSNDFTRIEALHMHNDCIRKALLSSFSNEQAGAREVNLPAHGQRAGECQVGFPRGQSWREGPHVHPGGCLRPAPHGSRFLL